MLLDNADRVVLLTEKERPRGRKIDISLTFLLPHDNWFSVEDGVSDHYFSRRGFLRASLLGVLCLRGIGSALATEFLEESYPVGRLSLRNIHTGEHLSVTYRTPDGEVDLDALNSINWLLRCHFTNQHTEMDLAVIEYLNMVDKVLGGGREFRIISGYRSPEYNRILSEHNGAVAKQSLHMEGKAIDIAVPGVSLAVLRDLAAGFRCGGGGYYPHSGFVHLDSGRFRTW